MESTPRRRTRSTGPSRSGAGARAGRGTSAARAGRGGAVRREPIEKVSGADDPGRGVATGSDSTRLTGPTSRIAGTRSGAARSGRTASSRPAGTRPGTAPSAAASVGGRRLGRLTARAAPKAVGVSRATSQLIKQVAVLGLVFCAVALALAVPLRNYLAQRAELGVEVSKEQQLRVSLAAHDQEKGALSDPAYIAAEAKRRLQYVKPGDTVYVMHAPPLAAPKVAAAPSVGPAAPWYSHLWDTLSDPTQTAAPGVPPSAGSAVSPSKAGR